MKSVLWLEKFLLNVCIVAHILLAYSNIKSANFWVCIENFTAVCSMYVNVLFEQHKVNKKKFNRMENFENWTVIVDLTIFEKGSLKVLLHFIVVLQSHGKDSSENSGSFRTKKVQIYL